MTDVLILGVQRVQNEGVLKCPFVPFDSNIAISCMVETKKGIGLANSIDVQYQFLLKGNPGGKCPYQNNIEKLGDVSGKEIEQKICKPICEHYASAYERGAFPLDTEKNKENVYFMKV